VSLARPVDRIRLRASTRGRVGRSPLLLAREGPAVARRPDPAAGDGSEASGRQDAPGEPVGGDMQNAMRDAMRDG
jgi:hypothetical protein